MAELRYLRDWLTAVYGSDEKAMRDAWAGLAPVYIANELGGLVGSGQSDLLATMVEQVAEPRVLRFIESLYLRSAAYFRRSSEQRVDCIRIQGALIGMVTGAAAVDAAVTGPVDQVARWTAESVAAWTGVVAGPMPMPCVGGPALSPRDVLESSFDRLWEASAADRQVASARCWVEAVYDAWRSTQPNQSEDRGRSHSQQGNLRRMPLLAFEAGGGGRMTFLVVEKVSPGTGEFYPDPLWMSLQPMASNFIAATQAAWRLARSTVYPEAAANRASADRFDVMWRIEADRTDSQLTPSLEGGSHGAALAIALVQLLADQVLDSTLVATATVDSVGRLGPVAGVPEKISAALAAKDARGGRLIHRIIVAPANLVEAQMGCSSLGFNPDEVIIPVETLDGARPFSTGHLDQLRRMVEGERASILAHCGRRLGRELTSWTELEGLVVVPLVRSGIGQSREPGSVSRTPNEASPQREELWSTAWRRSRSAVLISEPGFGKTTLLWGIVGTECSQALEHLSDLSRAAEPTGFALYVTARDIASALRDDAVVLDDPRAVAGCIARIVVSRHQLKESFIAYVIDRILDGKCLVAVDALDEAPGTARRSLDQALDALVRFSQVRIAAASRPEGYRLDYPLVGPEGVFQICPFRDQQMEAAIRAYLPQPEGTADAMWRMVRSTPSIYNLLQCPLMLRIACRVKVRDRLSQGAAITRSVELFQHLLDVLLTEWLRRSAVQPSLQQRAQLPLLAEEVALRDLVADADPESAGPLPLATHVTDAMRRFPSLAGRPVLDDLCDAGILMTVGVDAVRPVFAFTHKEFARYLAARALARLTNEAGLDRVWGTVEALTTTPDGQRCVVFMSGLLDDPGTLLQRLADPANDDVFRHRLALAAQCLPEIDWE